MPFIAFTDGRNRLATDSVESDCHTARCGAVRFKVPNLTAPQFKRAEPHRAVNRALEPRRTAVQRIDGGTRIFVCVTTSQALELGAGGKRRGETCNVDIYVIYEWDPKVNIQPWIL